MGVSVTATKLKRWIGDVQKIECTYQLTLPATMAGAGASLDLSEDFPNEVYGMKVLTDTGGYVLSYSRGTSGAPATGKVIAYRDTSLNAGAMAAIANATDMSAVQPIVEITGR